MKMVEEKETVKAVLLLSGQMGKRQIEGRRQRVMEREGQDVEVLST